MRRTSYGAVRTHCLIAVSGRMGSHRWHVASHIRLAEHDGHAPRHLQEYATTSSWPHFLHATRRKPWAGIPQRM